VSKTVSDIAEHDWEFSFPRNLASHLLTTVDSKQHLLGIGSDLGLITYSTMFEIWTPSPFILWLVMLISFVKLRCKIDIHALVIPLMLLCLPILLELATGYRKSLESSKLFIVAYPCVLGFGWILAKKISLIPPTSRRISFAFFLLVLVGITSNFKVFGVWVAARTGFIETRASEQRFVTALSEKLGATNAEELLAQPVLYVHYEPGVGLRNFAGGNLRTDLDFWSAPVQTVLAKEISKPWDALGRPPIYVSYDKLHYEVWTGINTWPLFLETVESDPNVCILRLIEGQRLLVSCDQL
jgi:hypothetical protein